MTIALIGGLVVTEVNPDHDPGGQLARLVDGLVAALARQGPRSPRTANDSFVEGSSS